jgi:hypothetical protein
MDVAAAIWKARDFLIYLCPFNRRGVRVVEGARLESVYAGNRIAGSNPALSAKAILRAALPH